MVDGFFDYVFERCIIFIGNLKIFKKEEVMDGCSFIRDLKSKSTSFLCEEARCASSECEKKACMMVLSTREDLAVFLNENDGPNLKHFIDQIKNNPNERIMISNLVNKI
jgi:hypothetical protein